MIHFVIGGARSGKSRFAENLAEKTGKSVFYVATATAGDEEMRQRITKHQNSRPGTWKLIEEPFYLSTVIKNNSSEQYVIILECMTLWLNNWLCSHDEESWNAEKQTFIDALLDTSADVIIVSNEVGSGIVPMGELSREFVDQSGWLNQALAQLSDQATLIVAGCPVSLSEKT